MAQRGFRTGPGRVATLTQDWKVVQTWSFRGSKSRNKVSVGEPAEGSLQRTSPARVTLQPYVNYTFVALASRSGHRLHAGVCSPEDPELCLYMSSEYYIIVKTFNNGSLGSGIDEERSEMR